MKKHFYHDEIVEICNCKHLTVDEIFEALSKANPLAWRSSVYRNVEELANKGELKKITWVWKKAYFEKNIWNHFHLIDKNTWKIVDLDLDIDLSKLPKDFKVDDYDVNIYWEFTS